MEDFWNDRPNEVKEQGHFEIMRTPAGGVLSGVITSDTFVGCNLHYYRGRSTPCRKNDCEACEAGHRPRWTGYVLLMSRKTRRVNILEFTARCYSTMQSMLIAKTSLRGVVVTVKRTSSRPNGPLAMTFEEDRVDPDSLPPAPDLREILERIWEVKEKQIPMNFERESAIKKNGKPTSQKSKNR